jgi:stage IV sporulation protein FB
VALIGTNGCESTTDRAREGPNPNLTPSPRPLPVVTAPRGRYGPWMEASVLQFQVLGFRVNVQATFLLIVALAALSRVQAQNMTGAIGWLVALPLGILVHELGHAWVARRYRLRVGEILLYGLGGMVSHSATTPGRQLAISLAGPFAGFALGGAALLLGTVLTPVAGGEFVWNLIVEPMATVTIFYGLVNLLPAFPLDGGNALRAALAVLWSDRVGLSVTGGLGALIGAGGVWYALNTGSLFLGLIAAFFVWTNIQALQAARL